MAEKNSEDRLSFWKNEVKTKGHQIVSSDRNLLHHES